MYTQHGLFPRPYAPGTCPKKVISLFDMLGKAMAKCLQDSRLIDLQLAPAFFRTLLSYPLDFSDLEHLDPGLAASLAKIRQAMLVRALPLCHAPVPCGPLSRPGQICHPASEYTGEYVWT